MIPGSCTFSYLEEHAQFTAPFWSSNLCACQGVGGETGPGGLGCFFPKVLRVSNPPQVVRTSAFLLLVHSSQSTQKILNGSY